MAKIISYLIWVFLLCTSLYSRAQEKDPSGSPVLVNVSYYGHYIFHPGVKAGMQFSIKNWQKERKSNSGFLHRSYFISPQLAAYAHYQNHMGMLMNMELGYQSIRPKYGFYTAYSLGFGMLKHFNWAVTYEWNENGSIQEICCASRSYFVPSLSMEFGQLVSPGLRWYSKVSLGTKLKHNTFLVPDGAIELGVKMNLKR